MPLHYSIYFVNIWFYDEKITWVISECRGAFKNTLRTANTRKHLKAWIFRKSARFFEFFARSAGSSFRLAPKTPGFSIRVFENSFFVMGRVYIDTCSTILLGELDTYNIKNLVVGSNFFFFAFFEFF